MRPAIIGIIAASDSSAMIALSARIERKLRQVGKVSRQQQREEEDQQDASGSAGRRPAAGARCCCQRGRPRQLGAGRLERVRLNGLHGVRSRRSRLRPSGRRAPRPRRAGSRSRGRRPPSSATTRPRSKTSARWQILATSSKSVETMTIAAPRLQRHVEAAGRSRPWRRRRRRRSGPRRCSSLRPRCSQRPTHHLLLVAAGQGLDRQRPGRWAEGRPARRAPARRALSLARREVGEQAAARRRSGLRNMFSRTMSVGSDRLRRPGRRRRG